MRLVLSWGLGFKLGCCSGTLSYYYQEALLLTMYPYSGNFIYVLKSGWTSGSVRFLVRASLWVDVKTGAKKHKNLMATALLSRGYRVRKIAYVKLGS